MTCVFDMDCSQSFESNQIPAFTIYSVFGMYKPQSPLKKLLFYVVTIGLSSRLLSIQTEVRFQPSVEFHMDIFSGHNYLLPKHYAVTNISAPSSLSCGSPGSRKSKAACSGPPEQLGWICDCTSNRLRHNLSTDTRENRGENKKENPVLRWQSPGFYITTN